MKLDPAELRRQYDSLSDAALLAMNREDLIEMAQQIYDEEVANRGIGTPTKVPPESSKNSLTESVEEMVEVATYTSGGEARLAKSFLISAEIPCELENELDPQAAELRLLVPASLLDEALEVLGAEISDEELSAQAESAGQVEPGE